MTEIEEPLEGGNMTTGVVRVGDTVRRAAGPWTETVHELLLHLDSVGYPVPRPIGLDDAGREVLAYIPGTPIHPDRYDVLKQHDALRRVGGLIADFHDAQTGFDPPKTAQWRDNAQDPTGSAEVVAHNDMTPWNLIVGPRWAFIDWDLASPGRRSWDLAWSLHSFVGLWPDTTHTAAELVARINAFCDGARLERSHRGPLLDVVVERITHHVTELRRRAGLNEPSYPELVADGHDNAWEQAAHFIEERRHHWTQLLSS